MPTIEGTFFNLDPLSTKFFAFIPIFYYLPTNSRLPSNENIWGFGGMHPTFPPKSLNVDSL